VGEEEEPAIGAISALAVVSLLLGLAAPLSLAAPLLWAIPLFGVAISLVTIRRIAASDGALIGRRGAVIGLALSVASLSAAASRAFTVDQMLSHEAQEFASGWLASIQEGRTQAAFDLTMESMRGPAPPPPPGQPPSSEPPRDLRQEFQKSPLIQYLSKLGKGAKLNFDHQVGDTSDLGRDGRLSEYFTVSSASGGDTKSVHIVLAKRTPTGVLDSRWYVTEYGGEDLPVVDQDQ
jgi:hypothetical protein